MVALYGGELRFGKRAAGVARAARGGTDGGRRISETKRDYDVGRGKPPVRSRFKKGQSGNPRGPRPKSLPALLVDALDEEVVATIDGARREITKREAGVIQRVNESAGADLHATKLLIDMLKDVEKKAAMTPQPAPAPFAAADEKMMASFIAPTARSKRCAASSRASPSPTQGGPF